MIDDPGDPSGGDPQQIWERKLMRFLRRHLVLGITNALRKPQATGGVVYEVMPQVMAARGKAGLTMFAITTLGNAEYFTARTWNGKTFGGADVLIAKPPRQRMTVETELMDGVTVTYSAFTDDNNRTAADGVNTEAEVCYPRYMTMANLGVDGYLTTPPTGTDADTFNVSQCIIFAEQPVNGTGVMTDETTPVPVTWLETRPARVWSKKQGT